MANFLIVAASSGIGQATVALLQQAGHNTFTTARDGGKISPDVTLDAADFEAVDRVFEQAIEKFGSLDGVVNCSGSLMLRAAHQTSKAQYQATVDASLTTAFAVVRAAGKQMTMGGSVVLISTAAAIQGFANHESIAAAKAGVIGLALAAAATYAPNRLRFNVVAPGLTETPLTAHLTGSPTARAVSESMHALGRLGQPDDIARAVAFFLEPANNWMTGQVLAVDGGLARIRPKMKI